MSISIEENHDLKRLAPNTGFFYDMHKLQDRKMTYNKKYHRKLLGKIHQQRTQIALYNAIKPCLSQEFLQAKALGKFNKPPKPSRVSSIDVPSDVFLKISIQLPLEKNGKIWEKFWVQGTLTWFPSSFTSWVQSLGKGHTHTPLRLRVLVPGNKQKSQKFINYHWFSWVFCCFQAIPRRTGWCSSACSLLGGPRFSPSFQDTPLAWMAWMAWWWHVCYPKWTLSIFFVPTFQHIAHLYNINICVCPHVSTKTKLQSQKQTFFPSSSRAATASNLTFEKSTSRNLMVADSDHSER